MTGGSSTPSSLDGGIRKKMRKGTHSCFECRRRKIRCVFDPGNTTVCKECFARGSNCVDQEHADNDVVVDQRKNLRERVAKLESLIETLIDDKSDRTSAAEALKKLGASDISNSKAQRSQQSPQSQLSQQPSHDSPRASITVPERVNTFNKDAPMLSLFDNAVLSRAEKQMSTTDAASGLGQDSVSSISAGAGQGAWQVSGLETEPSDLEVTRLKKDRTWQILIKALPAAEELQNLLRNNDHWWEMYKHKCPGIIGNDKTLEEFATRVLSSKDQQPAALGTLLLSVASCYPDRGEALDRALELVDQYITSDDDLTCSLEGLECCMLQGKCYSDIGQARKAWRIFRRAMTNAQMMGLHRNHRASAETDSLWWNLYMGDRMCSLMLGLPYAISDGHIDMTVQGKDVTAAVTPETFMLKSASIAGQVTDRLLAPKPASFSSAMELDQAMDKIASDLEPSQWWQIRPATSITSPKELVDWQVHVLSQMMFHQIRAYLHMPFMLQSATNKRYDYSRKACLDAAREMLRLYHLLRLSGFSVYQCKVVDFLGFTANIILLLGLLGYGRLQTPHDPDRDDSDWKMIETSIDIFREASNEKGGKVAEQSYKALKDFHQMRGWEGKGESDPSDPCPPDHTIVIPYFGRITIKRGKNFHHVPTPSMAGVGTPCGSTPQLSTPGSTTASSFHRTESSATSPSIASNQAPYSTGQNPKNASEQPVLSMDPFLSYDAGFWNPPHLSGTFETPQFGDEPLANYMSPPNTVQSGASTNSSAVNGDNWNLNAGAAMNSGFPWSNMSNMDIDQDWNSFMSDMQQGWAAPNTANQPQLGLI